MFKVLEQKTAILVFAQSATAEMRTKPISKDESLFEQLNDQILKEVKKTRVPYFHLSEELQIGKTFGERYANAIEFVFNKGYERVITVGNDSPELKAAQILAAKESLDNGKNVLGPSLDGGFYLLGIDRKYFNKNEFLQLPWQKQRLFTQIQAYFKAFQGHITKLALLQDIDTIDDVKTLLKKSPIISLSRKLRSLFSGLLTRPKIKEAAIAIPVKTNNYRVHDLVRGSP